MKIKVITVATTETKELKALIRSAERNGMDITVLGLNQPWQGFGMKVILTREYLKSQPVTTGYTHFIFVDAYDTLFLKPVTEVPDYIFFSVEKGCWPDPSKVGDYPDINVPWKYLNSGTYSAPIKDYLKLVEQFPIEMSSDDQRYFTSIFLNARVSGAIVPDYNCRLFQSYAFASEGDFSITDVLTNNITKTQPAIIHFNGKCIEPKIYNMVDYSTLQECKERWKDTQESASEIHTSFVAKVNDNQKLNDHRTFVENNIFGFGERSFHWMWHLIVKELPKEFTFLEVGVFKGQTLSLVKLLADTQKKKVKRYGVTPLSTEGGVWDSDYDQDIKTIHDQFKLTKDYTILKGLSEDPEIIKQASELSLDVLYIDGGHEERHVVNDLTHYAPLVKQGGYMVIDDCCNTFQQPFGYFQGIESVTRVVDRMLPPFTASAEWEFIFACVHNRVYKRL